MSRYRSIGLALVLVTIGSVAHAQTRDTRVEIESDGWRLIGDLRIPRSNRAAPVVLMLNKANGNRQAYAKLANHLAGRGIASLRLDLRAHGESVNKGKFGPPFDAPMQALVDGSDRDVSAAISYLKRQKSVDAARLGVLGASYSGEDMVVSARAIGFAKAYAALSPGSFSDESIKGIDGSGAAWLFIRSADERFLKEIHENIRKSSRSAQLLEVAGNKHASDMLDASPWLTETVAAWFKHNL
jgi:dienelactone hydrolase